MNEQYLIKYHYTYDKLSKLYYLFDDAESNELLRINTDLEESISDLFSTITVDKKIKSIIYRRLTWINHYLRDDDKESCKKDIRYLFQVDFPKILKISEPNIKQPSCVFVDQNRIDQLLLITHNDFDLKRMVQICLELNSAYKSQSYLSIAMLSRSLIDHVSPIFGCKKFQEVSNNYKGNWSFKKHMEHLNNSLRKIGDQCLHTHIRKKEVLPTFVQVDFSSDIDVLLSEIVRVLRN